MKRKLIGSLFALMVVAFPVVGNCQTIQNLTDKVPVMVKGQAVEFIEVGKVVESVELPNGEKTNIIKTTESVIDHWDNGLPVIKRTVTYTIQK